MGIDLDRRVVDALAAVRVAHAHRVRGCGEAKQERGDQQGEQTQQRGRSLLRGASADAGAWVHDVSIKGLDFRGAMDGYDEGAYRISNI